jgi:hypothetical protein
MNNQVYCVKRTHTVWTTSVGTTANYYNIASYNSSTWSPLITLTTNGSVYDGRVTLSYYDTNEGTIHDTGYAKHYQFWATIDGYGNIVIRVEYTD